MSSKKIFNVILVLFISLLFIIPSNVFAFTCDDNKTQLRCYYSIPDHSLVKDNLEKVQIIYTAATGVVFPHNFLTYYNGATHGEMLIDLKVCANGDGSYKQSIKLNQNLGDTWADDYKFENKLTNSGSASIFYDPDTNTGSCPKVKVTIDNRLNSKYNTVKVEYASSIPNKGKGKWSPKSFASNLFKTGKNIILSQSVYFIEAGEENNNMPWITDDTKVEIKKLENCEAILGEEDYSLGWIIKKALLYIKIFAPIIAVILSTFEFIKVLIQNDPDNMKKTYKKLIYRLIIAMLLFIIPSIISLLLDIFGFTAGNCNL